MHTTDKRHWTPSPPAASSRPRARRQRSHSLPIMEVLGCSTPEAELMFAEGMAAVHSRQQGRRLREGGEAYKPSRPVPYLDHNSTVSATVNRSPLSGHPQYQHSRIPSNVTDTSGTSTIRASDQSDYRVHDASTDELGTTVATERPLGLYSANLAQFIKKQLNSIPSYQPSNSPKSCSDLDFCVRTPLPSPITSTPRSADAPKTIQMPPIRPPLRSQFSACSSTDDDTADDEVPGILPDGPLPKNSNADANTPSELRYCTRSNGATFLLAPTPSEMQMGHASFLSSQKEEDHDGFLSSAMSAPPQLTPSSVPSTSSALTPAYFERKQGSIKFAPNIRQRIIAAVTPPRSYGTMLHARSPFEGDALASVHDIFVESQRRLLVDGLSFDMLREFTMADEGWRSVQTPC